MMFAILNNKLNLHQCAIADEMYRILGTDFVFIESCNDQVARKGYIYDDNLYKSRPYILRMSESKDSEKHALEIIEHADAIRVGGEPFRLVVERIKKGKLTFRSSERLFKTPLLFHRPSSLYRLWANFGRISCPNYRLLCQSAFLPNDVRLFGDYQDRCYKFAYFTSNDRSELESIMQEKGKDKLRIIWCARFLKLKHPELMVRLAEKLVKSGRDNFEIDMIGPDDNALWKEICRQIEKLGLKNHVALSGGQPNVEVLSRMRKSDVFVFTSDRREGWGVVLNEAMGAGCACVASNEIGAVPFLLKNQDNGLIFKSCSADSLFEKIAFLYDNPGVTARYGRRAFQTITQDWSVETAANRLITLADSILSGKEIVFNEGPCSKAYPCNHRSIL